MTCQPARAPASRSNHRGKMRMATATATAKARADKTRALGAQRAEVSQLTTYEWVALDKRGKRMKGDMPAKNASLVKADRKSTRLNSSHPSISYAVFCLKKKKQKETTHANK